MTQFIKDALRTCSPNFYSEEVSTKAFDRSLTDFTVIGNELDAFKKKLFYNKDPNPPFDFKFDSDVTVTSLNLSQKDINILHAILGLATEGVELVEALLDRNEGKQFDEVNLKEEAGDIFWYLAILANALDTDFTSIQDKVIEKLKARYPDKYTDANAINRDLETERKVLENG